MDVNTSPAGYIDNLSLDLRDQLLLSMPDHPTLRSAVLASRSLHEAYVLRSKSVVHAVIENQAGPAWPHALRLIRAMNASPNRPKDQDHLLDFELRSSASEITVTSSEALELGCMSQTARRFEDIFSLREKDRTSLTSALSSAESLRFNRAFYRFWSLTYFLRGTWIEDFDEDDDGEQPHIFDLPTCPLSREEGLELDRVWYFFADIFRWLHRTSSMSTDEPTTTKDANFNSCILYTPDQVIHFLDSPQNLETWDNTLTTSMLKIFIALDIESGSWIKTNHKALLPEIIVGGNDSCGRCHTVKGLRLWGRTNWDWLEGYIPHYTFPEFLPGLLRSNFVVLPELVSPPSSSHFSYSTMLIEMFDAQLDPYMWRKDQWLCLECITEFIKGEFYSWYVRRKAKENKPVQQDCWYGWNCRTQRRAHHAGKLNHLCEPTRGDPPPQEVP